MALDEKEKKIVGWRKIYDELLMKTIKLNTLRNKIWKGLMYIIIFHTNQLE